MKTQVALLLAALFVTATLPAATTAVKRERPPLLAAGTPAPDFTALNASDKPVKLSDFRGKYVLVDFWARDTCKISCPSNSERAKLTKRREKTSGQALHLKHPVNGTFCNRYSRLNQLPYYPLPTPNALFGHSPDQYQTR